MTSTPPTRRYARPARRSCTRLPTSSGASGVSSFATQTATWSTWSAITDDRPVELVPGEDEVGWTDSCAMMRWLLMTRARSRCEATPRADVEQGAKLVRGEDWSGGLRGDLGSDSRRGVLVGFLFGDHPAKSVAARRTSHEDRPS